jgi:UDP-2,3-diacylglucosamine pyrophosphatase LpxH
VIGSYHTGLVVDWSDGPLYLISDLHAGALHRDVDLLTKQHLIDLLRIVDHSNGRLIILGDLFDYWQESSKATPKQLKSWLDLFAQHIQPTKPAILITGNHDHWAGPALARYGFVLVRDHVMVTTTGRPWLLIHGDGLPSDGLNLIRVGLNKKFRNPVYNVLFPLLPLSLRIYIMKAFSNYRKRRGVDKMEQRQIHNHLSNWLVSSDFQGLVYGHTHEKDLQDIDGKYLANTGTFFADGTVMIIDGTIPTMTTVDELKSTVSDKMTYISPDGTRR